MSETKDTADKTLAGGRKPLSLQRTVESGHVRQSFSHGRSKSVVVEKRKTRKLAAPGGAEPAQPATPAAPAPSAPRAEAKAPPRPPVRNDAAKNDLLRPEERDARARALLDAKGREEEERRAAEIEARARAQRDAEERARLHAVDAHGKTTDVACVAGALGDAKGLPPPPDSWASQPDSDVAIWTVKMQPGARWRLPAASGKGTR
ncbi:MAG: IF-2-associated domain-containing protein, partial [Hyphomicrobium sp.]|uniref:IF-2-associated domain-containing protein n=1 Tax=Hyphomicrobium sp. TaxID=82 RepID=UPI0025BD5753